MFTNYLFALKVTGPNEHVFTFYILDQLSELSSQFLEMKVYILKAVTGNNPLDILSISLALASPITLIQYFIDILLYLTTINKSFTNLTSARHSLLGIHNTNFIGPGTENIFSYQT